MLQQIVVESARDVVGSSKRRLAFVGECTYDEYVASDSCCLLFGRSDLRGLPPFKGPLGDPIYTEGLQRKSMVFGLVVDTLTPGSR